MLLIPDSLTDYQTMKDMSTQLLKRRSGALITGEGKYVFCRGEAKWSRKMRKTHVLEKETLLRDLWTGGETDIKGSIKGPRGPKNKRINIRASYCNIRKYWLKCLAH